MDMEITFAGGKKVNASFKGHIHKNDQPINPSPRAWKIQPLRLMNYFWLLSEPVPEFM